MASREIELLKDAIRTKDGESKFLRELLLNKS